MRVIIPRECSDPRTNHCVGRVRYDGSRTACDFCGRFMPLDEVIDFGGDE